MTELEELQKKLNDIREALQKLTAGSHAYQRLDTEKAALEAQLAGSGALAQGHGATSVGEDGINVGGNLDGTLIRGEQNQIFRNSTVILAGEGAQILVGEHASENNPKPNVPSLANYPLTATSILTFLFTDIEGSTQLWENHPEAMRVALTRHDAILREAIESHKGRVFKTVGDAFYCAFPNTRNALKAAIAAQRALHAEPWGETTIKVRMALHTGSVEARDNDYFGPPLNRIARLIAAGHGGQVLLSATVTELVRANLPPDATLRDMGERRLKDLTRPEHIYQLLITDLPVDFPPLKTLDAFRTNLPAQMTSFIGREKEIATVRQLVSKNRITTLTGSGGAGKTRLSLQVAAQLLDSFPDGVWFVELAPLSDPALVPQTVMSTIGLREESTRTPLETLSDYLREKHALLLLDNCEHLIEATAQLTEALLQACPHLHMLCSSREALGIDGERAYRVPSLAIPDVHHLPPIEMLAQYEAVHLFVERAQTALPAFVTTKENAPAIAQICARLDGIPLAIELAAARVKMLKPEQIAERLDDRFRLLTGGSRTALPRHQTLRAMIDWSYGLLPESERVLLHRLSVFAGGWTLEAAETVCQGRGIDDYDVLTPLSQLVNKSLVVVDAEDEASETRYRLLETVRQYAREKLSETGESTSVRDAHLQFFLGLARNIRDGMNGPTPHIFTQKFDQEMDNFRGAFAWSINRALQLGLQMICDLDAIFGYMPDYHEILDRFANHAQNQSRTALRAKALKMMALAKIDVTLIRESLRIYQELDDQQGMAMALRTLAWAGFEPNPETRLALLQESLEIAQNTHDQIEIMYSLYDIGAFFGFDSIDGKQAYSYLNRGLAIAYEIKHAFGIETGLMSLAQTAIRQGDYTATRFWIEKLIEQNEQSEYRRIEIYDFLGRISYRENKYEEARLWFEKALSTIKTKSQPKRYEVIAGWASIFLGYTCLRQGDPPYAHQSFIHAYNGFVNQLGGYRLHIGFVCILEGFASLFTVQSLYTLGVTLFSCSDQARQNMDNPRPPNEQAEVDRDLATIRAHLDEASFAEAQAAGRAMSMDEAIALAMEATHE